MPTANGTTSPYELGYDDYLNLVTSLGESRYRADQIWRQLYKQCRPLAEAQVLPIGLRDKLSLTLHPGLRPITVRSTDAGLTTKFVWQLHDDKLVESVLMHYPATTTSKQRTTVCVSSQAGCAMGCTFCATGQAGFERNLTVGEILEQVAVARHEAEQRYKSRLSNVVFMGMGEPLANEARLFATVSRIHDEFEISARNICVSTVGVVPGIRNLADRELPVTLAISLHAANDKKRSQLVPLNNRYPIAEIVDACEYWARKSTRRISIEWAMITGTNDSAADCRELAAIARRLSAHVNLIPLNQTPGFPLSASVPSQIERFAEGLRSAGVEVTVRDTRGAEIDGACGQLRAVVSAELKTD